MKGNTMVSGKERTRLARMFDGQQQRLDRQKASITRLVAENVAMSAALAEIALLQAPPAALNTAQAIAKDCLEAVNRNRQDKQESESPETEATEVPE